MKAILQENNIPFAKVHDLEILLRMVKEFIPLLENDREDFIWLTAFGVEVRYPGFDVEKDDAKKAVASMKKIRKIIKSYLG